MNNRIRTSIAALVVSSVLGAAQEIAPGRAPIAAPSGQPGLQYRYYEANVDTTLDLSLAEPVRNGTIETFSFPEGIRRDYFGLEFWGAIEVPVDGSYTFYTRSDDGSRLYIGERCVVLNDYPHGPTEASGTIVLEAGRHPILVTYFETYVGEMLAVSWEGPEIRKAAVPPGVLTQHDRLTVTAPSALTTTRLSWPGREFTLAVQVDTRDAVDLVDFHATLPGVLREHYPKIVDIVGVEGAALPDKIRFSFRPGIKVPAYAGRGIVMSADWFRKRPGDLGCAIHELAHIVQRYPNFQGKPGWLVEGIADYVRHKVGLDDGWRIPQKYRESFRYTSGYGVTAAFLVFVETHHDRDLVATMNRALKAKSYTPELWQTCTGKPLDELWQDFATRYGK